VDSCDTSVLDQDTNPAVNTRHRFAVGIVDHLDILPSDASCPTNAQCFKNRFLGRESSGQGGVGQGATKAVLAFSLTVDSMKEPVLPSFRDGSDPINADQVHTDADDAHSWKIILVDRVGELSRRRSTQELLHFTHRLLEPHQDSACNDAVTDVELDDLWNLGQPFDVPVIEPVPGIDAHAELEC
jgi:hypothetical protein